MNSQLFLKVRQREERVDRIKVFLVFPVAAFHLAIMSGRVWVDELMPDTQLGGGFLKKDSIFPYVLCSYKIRHTRMPQPLVKRPKVCYNTREMFSLLAQSPDALWHARPRAFVVAIRRTKSWKGCLFQKMFRGSRYLPFPRLIPSFGAASPLRSKLSGTHLFNTPWRLAAFLTHTEGPLKG